VFVSQCHSPPLVSRSFALLKGRKGRQALYVVLVDLLLELLHLSFGLLDGQEVGVLLERGLAKTGLLPEIWGQIGVGLADGEEGSLHEVTHGLRATLGLGVHIIDTSELKHLLGYLGGDDTSSARGRDKAHGHGTALASYLHGHSVWVTDHVTPISTAHGNDRELSEDDSTTNGGGYFLGALYSQANVTIMISNDDEGLEASPLTSASLFLHWHDLHNLILQLSFLGGVEEVYYLILLDRQREKVNFLKALD